MIQFGLRLHDAEKLPIEQVLPLVANIRCMQALGASERGAMGTSGRAYFDAHFEMTSQVRRLVELLQC